jgi:hypothetical protein
MNARTFHNIETRRINGYKIGYDASGRSWRIYGKSGNWTAVANITMQGHISRIEGYERLAEISAKLSTIGE